jgi:hypothetical protein
MSVMQWIVNLNSGSTAYDPVNPQVTLPFEPDSVLFIHLGQSRVGESPGAAGDVEICFDEVLGQDNAHKSTNPDQLLLSAAGPGQSISLNDRFTRIFFRMSGGMTSAAIQVVATKAK